MNESIIKQKRLLIYDRLIWPFVYFLVVVLIGMFINRNDYLSNLFTRFSTITKNLFLIIFSMGALIIFEAFYLFELDNNYYIKRLITLTMLFIFIPIVNSILSNNVILYLWVLAITFISSYFYPKSMKID